MQEPVSPLSSELQELLAKKKEFYSERNLAQSKVKQIQAEIDKLDAELLRKGADNPMVIEVVRCW